MVIYFVTGFVQHASFIIFGLFYGVAIYKSRLCFATAFYGNRELMSTILISLAIASIGSLLVVSSGLNIPPSVPVGPHTFLGSLMFGLTMPFAGGCMTGLMYRFGGGQLKALVALGGLVLGNFIGAYFVWERVEPYIYAWGGPSLFLHIGPLGALLLNLFIIGGLLLILNVKGSSLGLKERLLNLRHNLKQEWWPPWLGGLVIALVFIIQFASYSSLSIQIPIARLTLWTTSQFVSIQENAWANRWGLREPYNDPLLLLVISLIVGAMIASTHSDTFACFQGGRRGDLVTGFVAGFFMGVAVWIAVGCNVSGFWASVATLRPEGWIYAAGMFLGAKIGLKLLEKFYV